jgi:hypothetical protein
VGLPLKEFRPWKLVYLLLENSLEVLRTIPRTIPFQILTSSCGWKNCDLFEECEKTGMVLYKWPQAMNGLQNWNLTLPLHGACLVLANSSFLQTGETNFFQCYRRHCFAIPNF